MKIDKNRKYIVRSVEAGVFYGYIDEKDGNEVTMSNVRCLWAWRGANSLNDLAAYGVKYPNDCKFTNAYENITILGVCEILPCSDRAVQIMDGVEEWIAK